MLISELLEPGCVIESYYLSMMGVGEKIQLEYFLVMSVCIRKLPGRGMSTVDVVMYDTRRNKIRNATYGDSGPPASWTGIIYTDGRAWQAVQWYQTDA